MAVIAEEWGYLYKGLVYDRFNQPPPMNVSKWLKSYRLYTDLEICDGPIRFTIIQVHYGHHTGGALSAYMADPIFQWGPIR